MDTQRQSCDSEPIERFLADRLGAEELAAFESHLDACLPCRQELEARAADESWWSEARDCLAASGPSSSSCSLSSVDPASVEGTQSWQGRAGEARSSLIAVKPYLAPTDDPRMIGRVGPYEIVGVIGSGGNGVVLKGFDAALNRYVAVKLLSPRLADSGAARRRFSREAQAAAAVVHDNVMAIHAVAETQGLPYLVMPYVRGPSLEKRLRTNGPLALEEVLRVGMQVAAGLAAAHAQGLVHRDIKPANILLEEGVERVKITDFGLARAADDASLTRSGVIAGTPQYMSPEQARGEPVDHRTDLFSLGCVLYAACAGRSPFRAETSYAVLRKICDSEPRAVREINAAIPAWLAGFIERLLAKQPSQRYASATEVAALLERCLAHVQQPATVSLPDELVEPPLRGWSKWAEIVRSISGRLALAATAAVLLVGIGLMIWFQQAPDPGQEHSSNKQPAVSPANPPDGAPGWNDAIDEEIDLLSTDIDRLRSHTTIDLWHDSLTGRIEQLKSDVKDLGARVIDEGAQESNLSNRNNDEYP